MRIDAHTHLGLNGYTSDSLIQYMDRHGIDRSCLLSWEEREPPLPSLHIDLRPEPILEAAKRHPDRFIPFYAPDPKDPKALQRLKQSFGQGFKGCGELKVSLQWKHELLTPYLECLNGLKSALIVHMEQPRQHYLQEKEGRMEWVLERLMNDKFNGVSGYYLDAFASRTGILKKKIRRNRVPFPGILYDFEGLENRLKAFPNIRFVGHGPGFWNAIAVHSHPRYIHQKGRIRSFGLIDRLLEEYDNLFCDLSGHSGFNAMNRDKPQSKLFLEKHANKVMFGSDNTGLPLIDLLESLKLDKGLSKDIMGRTAEKVLLN